MENIHGSRRKVLFLAGLIGVGIVLGAIVLYVVNLNGITNGATDVLAFEFEDGRLILDAEDREHLKEQALAVTLQDDKIKALIDGKDYTTQVTLFGNVTFESFDDYNVLPSEKRFVISDEHLDDLNVVVTITLDDGSGYNVAVDWKNWSVGEPEFSEQVSPPKELIRIGPEPRSRENFLRSMYEDN